MQISLHSILTQQSFDWTCRRTQAALLENMVVVVKEMTKIEMVAMDSSSTLYKAMVKLYNMVKKPKNMRKGLAAFLKQEDEELRTYMLVIQEEVHEDEVRLTDGEYDDEEDEEAEEGEEKKSRKKKKYDKLKTEKVKKARVENVVEMMKNDAGLENDVFEHLKLDREDSGDKEVVSEAFKLCCLNLMKTLHLSDTKYDDLRWWVEDVITRGFSLSSMPTSRALKEKVNKEMVPPDMQSSETGARFDLKGTLFHHGE